MTGTGEFLYQNFTYPPLIYRNRNHQFHYYVPSHYSSSKPIGLMLWLHGGGGHFSGEIDWLYKMNMRYEPYGADPGYARPETDNSDYILVYPIAPFDQLLPSGLPNDHASRWNVPAADDYLMDIITEMGTRYNIDYNRVVLTGFSMGGIGCYHQALRLNDRIAAALLAAGSWKIYNWELMNQTPVFIIHGTNDETHAKFEYALLAHEIMQDLNISHVWRPYTGGHAWTTSAENSWKEFVNGKTGWITDKYRDPYPNQVLAINPRTSYETGANFQVTWKEDPSPHTYWVSINEIGDGTIPYWDSANLTKKQSNIKGGSVLAKIIDRNRIELKTSNVKNISLWLHPKLVEINKPITIIIDGRSEEHFCNPSLLDALRSYERRKDWELIYSCEIVLDNHKSIHPADKDQDGCITDTELLNFINLWKRSDIGIGSLIGAIRLWKVC